jgi:hypothetical protein
MYKRISRVFAEEHVPNRHCVWANNAATLYEPFIWDAMMVEDCGGTARSREIDQLTAYPMSLFTYMGHGWSGLISHMFSDAVPVLTGDDPRFDNQRLGLAMLNDFGLNSSGPHGQFMHFPMALRLLNRLHEFGFFQEDQVEMLPYWRNGEFVSYGEEDGPEVYVTVYRTPLAEGQGYRAIFALLNYADRDVMQPLVIRDPERILGGENTLTAGQLLRQIAPPEGMQGLWEGIAERAKDRAALRDFETDELIESIDGEGTRYGSVHIPFHRMRILYAEHRE